MIAFLDRLRLSREPVAYVTLALAIALTAYNVYVKHTPLSDLLTDNYWQYVLGAAASITARFSVFAKGNVEVVPHPALTTELHEQPGVAGPGPSAGPTGQSEADEDAVLAAEELSAPGDDEEWRS